MSVDISNAYFLKSALKKSKLKRDNSNSLTTTWVQSTDRKRSIISSQPKEYRTLSRDFKFNSEKEDELKSNIDYLCTDSSDLEVWTNVLNQRKLNHLEVNKSETKNQKKKFNRDISSPNLRSSVIDGIFREALMKENSSKSNAHPLISSEKPIKTLRNSSYGKVEYYTNMEIFKQILNVMKNH